MRKAILLVVVALLLVPTTLLSKVAAEGPDSRYFRVRTIAAGDGTTLAESIISGPPERPPGYASSSVSRLPEPNLTQGINVLSGVPAFNWSFGCSATSAAMIAGYYDRTGYPNMYTGPTNGGLMPLDNSSWPDWEDSAGDTRHQCPLSATHNGLDGRTTNGHVDDYWISYLEEGPDPFEGNWPEHSYGDCTADYMKTNQWAYDNADGSTTFYNYTDGSPLYWYDIESSGIDDVDGGYGIKLFYESRGYTVTEMYNQYIRGYASPTSGFTYDQFKAEIDAGRPVMIHLEGHTMVGIGYDDASDTIYIHDTWDHTLHTMTWGGSYSGMQQYGVTIVQLAPGTSPPPVPTNVQASDGTYTDKVEVTWDSSSGANDYEVYRATSATGTKSMLGNPSSTSFDDTSAAVGTTYYYWLKACNEWGCSDFSTYDTGYSSFRVFLPMVMRAP